MNFKILIFLCYLMIDIFLCYVVKFEDFGLDDCKWMNKPPAFLVKHGELKVITGNHTDFWQETYYNFTHDSGHIFGAELKDDFTMTACIEADFTTLYDQAGLMIYVDEEHWLKAGIEYNDGQPMIGSVLTNLVSDWATGIYLGNPRKFYLRMSKVNNVVVVKYSTDNVTWVLLRLSPFPVSDYYFVGPMACTPQRQQMHVKFSEITLTRPADDILHAN